MTTRDPDARAMEDPEGRLEQAFIDEFLRSRGLDQASVHRLPPEEARRILAEASSYATSRLAEIEARAHYVHQLHVKE